MLLSARPMGASRIPGPIGLSGRTENLDDGTMARAFSPRPGFTSAVDVQDKIVAGAQVPAAITSSAGIPVIRLGSRGAEVHKLQQLLNVRLTPSPRLRADGLFARSTQEALAQYQRALSIPADGVAGKRTWYHLLKGDNAAVP